MGYKHFWLWVGSLIILVAMTGCGTPAEETGGQAEGIPAFITCEVYYRPAPSASLDGSTFSLSTAGDQETLSFETMTFAATTISDAGEGQSLSIVVTETTSGAELTRGLYQFDPVGGLRDQFIGGHGFTGLAYVFHPASGGEIQYFCGVGE
jgi:hypothetical protein